MIIRLGVGVIWRFGRISRYPALTRQVALPDPLFLVIYDHSCDRRQSAPPSPPSLHPPPPYHPALLLGLHIRRGDYVDHCMHIANLFTRFMGFNEFPCLLDRFSLP